MRQSLVLLLVLRLPGVAGAAEIILDKDQSLEKWVVPSREEMHQIEVDRFLAEKVQPEIEAGERILKSDPGYATGSTTKGAIYSEANYHLIKALVLLEQERLRRDSR